MLKQDVFSRFFRKSGQNVNFLNIATNLFSFHSKNALFLKLSKRILK